MRRGSLHVDGRRRRVAEQIIKIAIQYTVSGKNWHKYPPLASITMKGNTKKRQINFCLKGARKKSQSLHPANGASKWTKETSSVAPLASIRIAFDPPFFLHTRKASLLFVVVIMYVFIPEELLCTTWK